MEGFDKVTAMSVLFSRVEPVTLVEYITLRQPRTVFLKDAELEAAKVLAAKLGGWEVLDTFGKTKDDLANLTNVVFYNNTVNGIFMCSIGLIKKGTSYEIMRDILAPTGYPLKD